MSSRILPPTLDEDPTPRLSPADIAREFHKHPSVVNRWMTKGVRGQKLASFFEGGRRYTTQRLLDDFRARLNAASHAAPTPAPQPKTTRRRTESSRRAGELCAAHGY